MEQDGRNYYREVAQRCEDEWLKGIFEFLALEENKHYNIFNNMKNKVRELEFSNIDREKCLNIFQTKSKEELLKSLSQVQTEIYIVAAEDEKKSISLYEKMLEEVETEEERKQLLSIIEEEKKHLKFMEEIIELMHKLEQ
jgi:rubrerythrin